MTRTIDSSGLTGFTIPGGQIVATVTTPLTVPQLNISIKTAAGNDPSPTEPLLTAFRTSSGSGAAFSGRYITAPLTLVIYHNELGIPVGNVPLRVWLVLIDDGGTLRIGFINCSQSTKFTFLDESKLISSTIESSSTAGGSAGVFYTNTAAVSSKSFRILGFMTFNAGFGTGVWDTAPDVVQMFGPGVPKPGQLVQSAAAFDSTYRTVLQTIPFDNTIPQISEGRQIFLLPYTSQSPANWIEHEVLLQGAESSGAPTRMIGSIFQDSVANAIAAGVTDLPASAQGQLRLLARAIAGTQASSFSVNVGVDAVFNPASIISLGGSIAAARFNGTMFSEYNVKEYMA